MSKDARDLEQLRFRIKSVLTMVELVAKDGQQGRREGVGVRIRCPFHEEKSASFVAGSRGVHKGHCFGCGWDGDIFDYWAERQGLDRRSDHVRVVNELASLVGIAQQIEGVKWERPEAKEVKQVTGDGRIKAGLKPKMPPMRMLKDSEIIALAKMRGLSAESVKLAAHTFKRVGACRWPLYEDKRTGCFGMPCLGQWGTGKMHWFGCDGRQPTCKPLDAWPSWVVTDEARWVAQMRRLDGEMYPKKDGDPFKSYTLGVAKWPLGTTEIGARSCVLLVEGGPDMLAAYHFLHAWRRLSQVAVVCVLGASVILSDEALPYFAGKRVRIIAQNDDVKEKVTKRKDGTESVLSTHPGLDAAAKWQEQLRGAGATVETFSLGPLVDVFGPLAHLPDELPPCAAGKQGRPLNDLNELAWLPDEVLHSQIVRDAFCEWKEGFGG